MTEPVFFEDMKHDISWHSVDCEFLDDEELVPVTVETPGDELVPPPLSLNAKEAVVDELVVPDAHETLVDLDFASYDFAFEKQQDFFDSPTRAVAVEQQQQQPEQRFEEVALPADLLLCENEFSTSDIDNLNELYSPAASVLTTSSMGPSPYCQPMSNPIVTPINNPIPSPMTNPIPSPMANINNPIASPMTNSTNSPQQQWGLGSGSRPVVEIEGVEGVWYRRLNHPQLTIRLRGSQLSHSAVPEQPVAVRLTARRADGSPFTEQQAKKLISQPPTILLGPRDDPVLGRVLEAKVDRVKFMQSTRQFGGHVMLHAVPTDASLSATLRSDAYPLRIHAHKPKPNPSLSSDCSTTTTTTTTTTTAMSPWLASTYVPQPLTNDGEMSAVFAALFPSQ